MKLQLVLTVDYGQSSITREQAKANLEYIAQHAASEGLMTGDTEGEVASWRSEVRTFVDLADMNELLNSTDRETHPQTAQEIGDWDDDELDCRYDR